MASASCGHAWIPRGAAARESRSAAFTLIELLVVVAIITLLIGIALPSLRGAREQAKRAYCLSNLRSVGAGALAYAADDKRELLIPIHQGMMTPMSGADYWLRRTAIWFAYGGRSAPQPFLTDAGERTLDAASPWAATTRPLNNFLLTDVYEGDDQQMEFYRCPSDRGYPLSYEIDDSPYENADRPCFDTLGNSYRASLYAIFPPNYAAYDGAFAIGPWGHRLSTIQNAGQTIAFGEPTFFNMIGLDNGVVNPDPVIALGWHQRLMIDNLVYCDGSARPTRAVGHEAVEEEVARERMDLGDNWGLISRGPGWRFDLWPTPGARIWAQDPADLTWNAPYSAHGDRAMRWPFAGAQDNLR